MAQARTIVLWALTAAVVVLAATGVALYFAYRPDSAASWPDVSGPLSNDITFGSVVRDVHGWAAWLALPTAVVAGVPLARRARPTERVAPGLATGVGLVLVVVAASVTGYLLPWDQLALFAVAVGTNISGYLWLRDGSVRFALMDGTEIAPATLFKWLLLHAVVLGGALAAFLVMAWRRARAGAGDAPPERDETTSVEVPAGV